MKNDYYDRILKPITSRAYNKMPVFGFDVETEHIQDSYARANGNIIDIRRQRFIMGSVVGKNTKKVFWEKEQMKEYLLSRKMMDSLIFATNLEFDLNQIFDDPAKDFKLIYRHGLLAAIKSDSEQRKENPDHIRRRRWTFLDTTNFMRVSLADLGRIVGINKMDHPPSMIQNPGDTGMHAYYPRSRAECDALEEYNVNDSTITYRFGEHFRNFCTDHNMKAKLTIGSSGLDFFRRNYMPYPMLREPEDMLRLHFLGSMRGGATIVYKRGTYDGRLWYYDIRSSYPAQLHDGVDGKGTYPFPGTYIRQTSPSTEHIENYEGICHAIIKAPDMYAPPLGVKSDGKLLFGTGTFSGWFTNVELRRFMDIGYESTPTDMIIYPETWTPFRDCVAYLYKLRKKYKIEGHPYQAMVKILMNSGLFGKWATNFYDMEELISSDLLTYAADGKAYIDGEPVDDFMETHMGDVSRSFITRKIEAKPFRYSFPVISSYTCALGRIALFRCIKGRERHTVYSDTDSVTMTRPCIRQGDELGDWELEHKCKGGVFIRPKWYKLNLKDGGTLIKSKGVPKKVFPNSYSFYKAIGCGGVDIERFTRMKESNRMGIHSGTIIPLHKIISNEDDKRDWGGCKFNISDWRDSMALTLQDGQTKAHIDKEYYKAMSAYHKTRDREIKDIIASDHFDTASVGSDITAEEHLAIEMENI